MSRRTLVVQSLPPLRPRWVERCVESVRNWARDAGLDHEVLGDELLDLAPTWVVDAAADVLPVTDVARLVLLAARLEEGWHQVVWLDADVLVFAEEVLDLGRPAPLAACREVWVTGGAGGGLRAVELVCNAALAATSQDTVRALLGDTLAAARAHTEAGGPIPSRALGPDLLTTRQRRRPLPLLRGVTLLSPKVVEDVAAGGGPAAALHARVAGPVGAANLCASTETDAGVVERCVDQLLDGRRIPTARAPTG